MKMTIEIKQTDKGMEVTLVAESVQTSSKEITDATDIGKALLVAENKGAVAAQITSSAALAHFLTEGFTADDKNAVRDRLGITSQNAIANVAADAVDAAQNTAINAILAALRANGILKTE